MARDIEMRDGAGAVRYSLWTGRERRYVFPDGRSFQAPQEIGWCHSCRAFVIAQEVPPLDEIEGVLEAIKSGPDALEAHLMAQGENVPHRFFTERRTGFSEMMSEWYGHIREWRLLRQSPPRCFKCYSFEVDLLPKNASETTDPTDGHRLSIGCHSLSHLINRWSYDVEGLPLKDTRSP